MLKAFCYDAVGGLLEIFCRLCLLITVLAIIFSFAELLPKSPTMYIEVSSVDSWERYRLEGYGYTTIPSTPGKHTGQCCPLRIHHYANS